MATEEETPDLVLAQITITYSLDAEGNDLVEVEAADEQGEIPALITLLGMMDLARGCLYDMTGNKDASEQGQEDEEA